MPIVSMIDAKDKVRALYAQIHDEISIAYSSQDTHSLTTFLEELADAALHDRTIKQLFFEVRLEKKEWIKVYFWGVAFSLCEPQKMISQLGNFSFV